MIKKKSIVVLESGVNPTSYYWLSHLNANFINLKDRFSKKLLQKADSIILVRYIPFSVIFDLIKLFNRKTNIILLLDDNLLSLNIFSELPFLYKIRLFFKIYCYKNFLRFFISEIWVTNNILKNKVKSQLNNKINIKVMDLRISKITEVNKLFKINYIGTSSHVLELRWIKKILKKIQAERNDCLIELFIDKSWYKYFKSIPRLKMIFPMDWNSFLLDSQNRCVDIVLNPILLSNFNLYRSPTKFFDTTRLGAVGIYSKNLPYSNFINNNFDGILLENNLDLWCENIHFLLDNKDKRNDLYSNALKRLKHYA